MTRHMVEGTILELPMSIKANNPKKNNFDYNKL